MFGDGGPIVDAFFAPASAVVALVALAWHLAFRKGSSWVRRAVEGDNGQFVKGCFAALPFGLLVAGGALMGLADLTGVAADYVGVVAIFFVPVVAWGIKELNWPTLRRTPEWLRVALRDDPRLRDKVIGRRTPPW